MIGPTFIFFFKIAPAILPPLLYCINFRLTCTGLPRVLIEIELNLSSLREIHILVGEGYWVMNSGPRICQEGMLPFEPHNWPFLLYIFTNSVLHFYPGWH
jgi:hypothetical protein